MKGRAWRRLGIALGILTILSIAIAIIVPRLLDLNRYHALIVSTIQKAVGGTVRLGRISWGITPGIWVEVDGIGITDASALPGDLSASRVYVSVSISPLLHKKIVLNRVLLERPDVRLRLVPSDRAGGPGPSSSAEGTKGKAASVPIEVEIRQLAIEKGHVAIEDALTLPGQRVVWAFSDVDITASQGVPGGEIAFDLALRDEAPTGLGAVKAQGTFRGLTTAFTLDNPRLDAQATISSFQVNAIQPYLQGSPLGRRLGGSASLSVHYEGDLSSHHRAEGSIDVSQMTYTDPSLWPTSLASADAAVNYAVSVTPDEVAVEKLELKLGRLSVRARGRVQDLSGRPILKNTECSADLPLPELSRFIPWKVMGGATATLQPMLESGGRIVFDRAVLPEIALAGPSTPAENVLRKIEATAQLSGMSIQPSPSIPRFRNIRGTVRLADGIALVQGLRAQVASVDLPDISARLTNVFRAPRIEATLKGPLTLTQASNAELAAHLHLIGLEEASGSAEVDLAVTVDTAQPENFQLQGKVGLREVKAKTAFSPARLEGFSADLAITPAVARISSLATTVVVPEAASAPGGRFTLQLQGQVDGWRQRPAITVQHLKTSPMALPIVASLLPWEKLGDSARPVKEVLLAGGTVTIEELALPPITLSAPPNAAELVPRARANVTMSGLAMRPTPHLPRFAEIAGHLSLTNGVLKATDVRGRMGPLSVGSPGVSATITRLLNKPRVQATLKGPLTLPRTPDAELAALLRQLGVEEASGVAEVDLAVTVDTAQPEKLQLQGKVGLREVNAKPAFGPARLEGLTADLGITPSAATISTLATTVVVPADASAHGGRFTMQLQGRVDGWRRNPSITLQRLQTSPLPLPAVASALPWERLGDSARPIRDVFQAGGTATIDELVLPPIKLSAPPDPARLIHLVKASGRVTDLAVQPPSVLPRIEGITGNLSLTGGALTATDIRGRVGPFSLPGLNIRAKNLTQYHQVTVQAKGLLHVAATSDKDVERLLRQYGLNSLTGRAAVDMRFDYDRHAPDDWKAQGTLLLDGVRAETYPEAVVVDNLRGRVTVSRAKSLDLVAEDVSARVNQAPVRISGKFLGLGTPGLMVNATAFAKQLNLAHVREFFPALKQVGLAGTLDMDLDVYLPLAVARKARLNGAVATHGLAFRMPAAHFTVKEGDGQFTLSGDSVNIQRLQLRVNDQAVDIIGHISNPAAPDVQLAATSSDLDLDRLIPPGSADRRGGASTPQSLRQSEATAEKSELPPMARQVTGQIQIQARQGRYKGFRFQDLKLGAAYGHGLLSDWALDFGFSGGQVSAKGSADLRDPERVAFVVRPQITALDLGAVALALGIDAVPVTGPLSLTGQLQGHTGSAKELLASLAGNLDATMGPGRFTKVGKIGAPMAKLLSFASVQGWLSGRLLLSDLTGKGLAYRSITAQTSFDRGTMRVGGVSFQSDAVNIDVQGTVDLIGEQLAIQVALRPLGTAGKVLGFLPIVGKPVQAITSVHLEAIGPLDDPDIRLALGQGIESAIKGEEEGTDSIFKGVTGFFRKGAGKSPGK